MSTSLKEERKAACGTLATKYEAHEQKKKRNSPLRQMGRAEAR